MRRKDWVFCTFFPISQCCSFRGFWAPGDLCFPKKENPKFQILSQSPVWRPSFWGLINQLKCSQNSCSAVIFFSQSYWSNSPMRRCNSSKGTIGTCSCFEFSPIGANTAVCLTAFEMADTKDPVIMKAELTSHGRAERGKAAGTNPPNQS